MLGRLEKVDLSCTYSRVKIIGTFLCVLGALTMSILQSISTTPITAKEGTIQLLSPPNVTFDRHKIIGCLYLLAAIFILSSNIVLQVTLKRNKKENRYIQVALNLSVCLISCLRRDFPHLLKR